MAQNWRPGQPAEPARAQVLGICQAAKVMELDGLARFPAGAGVNAWPPLHNCPTSRVMSMCVHCEKGIPLS